MDNLTILLSRSAEQHPLWTQAVMRLNPVEAEVTRLTSQGILIKAPTESRSIETLRDVYTQVAHVALGHLSDRLRVIEQGNHAIAAFDYIAGIIANFVGTHVENPFSPKYPLPDLYYADQPLRDVLSKAKMTSDLKEVALHMSQAISVKELARIQTNMPTQESALKVANPGPVEEALKPIDLPIMANFDEPVPFLWTPPENLLAIYHLNQSTLAKRPTPEDLQEHVNQVVKIAVKNLSDADRDMSLIVWTILCVEMAFRLLIMSDDNVIALENIDPAKLYEANYDAYIKLKRNIA